MKHPNRVLFLKGESTMYDIVALGELLMDCVCESKEIDHVSFQANPGGAPANVLAMATQLGNKCAMIGKVGDDVFGQFLKNVLNKQGIDTNCVISDPLHPTTLAIVTHDEQGDRSFSFYRSQSADIELCEDDVDEDLFTQTKVFHFGSLSMCEEPARSATLRAIQLAKTYACKISYDPNLRKALWKSETLAREQMRIGCEHCDFLKLTEEELYFMSQCTTVEEGIAFLKQFPITLILLTKGSEGCVAYWNDEVFIQPAYVHDQCIDTTGAGDTFFGCIISYLCHCDFQIEKGQLKQAMKVASAAASLITMRKGALCAMPTKQEIDEFLNDSNRSFVV